MLLYISHIRSDTLFDDNLFDDILSIKNLECKVKNSEYIRIYKINYRIHKKNVQSINLEYKIFHINLEYKI